MQLDVESLRTYLAVLDHGGMTRAAEHLQLTQSAVSWKIKRLEERVGRPRLVRAGHTLRPTREGRSILVDARILVETHDRAVARLHSSEPTGHVRVGSNEEVDPARLAGVLGRFTRVHPGTTIEFIVEHTEHLVQRLRAGEIDVAIIQVDEAHLEPDDEVLWDDPLCWATSSGDSHDDDIIPLVTFGEHCGDRPSSEPLLAAEGLDFTVSFSVSTNAGVRAAIEAGLGVGLLGESYLGGDVIEWPEARRLDPLPPVFQIARTPPGSRSPMVEALLESIVDELRGPAPVVA